VVFRHGISDSKKDAGPKCEEQRALTPEGRKELETLAENLKTLKVSFAKVVSSPMCRAKDTAKILSGMDATTDAALLGEPGKSLDTLMTEPTSGNALLVTHSNVAAPLAPAKIRMVEPACCLIFAKDDKGKFRCVAHLTPADWDRLSHASK
jgi:phosphohistidine phosphatase SixA